ncbi:hypothetical protein KAW18_11460 [candidate division WOR-3 bacterium]|nr:hypothetical protein [candidate division WOR-3 bacterium]
MFFKKSVLSRTIMVMFLIITIFCTNKKIYAARPLFTEGAETVPPSDIKLELGFDYHPYETYFYYGEEKYLDISLIHGLSSRLDLEVNIIYEIEYQSLSIPPDARLKYALIKESDRIPSISLAFTILYPYPLRYRITGISTKTFKPFTFHANIGYEAGWLFNYWHLNYSTAIEFGISKRFDIVAEIRGKGMSIEDFKSTGAYLIGMRFHIFENLFLDFAGWRDFNDKDKYWDATFGITFGF